MQASRSSRFGEKFGRRRSGLASSVFTASRLPEARSTTRLTTENAPRPITSQTSKRRSKSRGVPKARPTVLDSASKAAPRSPCSSVGGAAASRSHEPLATPRGRFWEWCEGIFVASLRWRLEPYVGGVRGRARRSKRLEEAGQALRPSFKSWSGVREPCAAGAPGRAPQSSDELRSPWGLRTGRHGSVHVAPLVKNGFYCAFARRPFRFLGRARREAYARVVPAFWLARPGAKNQEGDCHKAPRESA